MASTVPDTKSLDEVAEIQEIEKVLLSFGMPAAEPQAEDFRKLYQHYKPSLTNFAASSKATDPDGVADLALFDGYRALGSMERRDYHGFRGYLFRAARSHLARERRRSLTFIPTAIDDDLLGPGFEFESEVADSMALEDLISKLPSDQQAVVNHRFFHGLTAEETGRLLGKKPNAVYQLQHRATRRLHRMMLAALILLALAVGAAVLLRQANTQVVDSSPARPDRVSTPQVDQPNPSGETAPDPEPSPTPEDARPPAIETSSDTPAEEDTVGVENQADTTPATTPSTVASVDAATTQEQEGPEDPGPTDDEQAVQADDQPAPTTTTTEVASQVPTAPPVAINDIVQATFGQPVNMNVLANDSSPTIDTDVVTVTSGGFDGLTLGADGQLTGTPTRTGYGNIVYRLTAASGSTSIGIVEITVD